jgi:hypothetical protein
MTNTYQYHPVETNRETVSHFRQGTCTRYQLEYNFTTILRKGILMWTAMYVNNELRRGVTKFLKYVQKAIKSETGQ